MGHVSLASTKFAASQYALMTSLCALPGSLLAGASGFVIVYTGFEDFFIGASLIGIPVALLAWFVWRNHPPHPVRGHRGRPGSGELLKLGQTSRH